MNARAPSSPVAAPPIGAAATAYLDALRAIAANLVIGSHLVAYGLYLTFERHYRHVARWLRPRFEQALLPQSRPARLPTAHGTVGLGAASRF